MWWHLLVAVLLLAGWHMVSPLRQRAARLERELKQQQQEVVARQQEVDLMLGQLKDMVVRMDRQGRVLWANPRAKKMLPLPSPEGENSQDGSSKPLSMAQMQRDPEWGARLEQALQRLPEASDLPILHMNNNGSGDLLSFSLQLLPLGEDQALLLCNDITESLRQQKQRDELFANLMHDLKTPLTSLIGYSNTLTTLGDNKQIREQAGAAIARAAKRVNRLLDSLLLLANNEKNNEENSQPSCHVPDVAQLVIEGVQDIARENGVKLVLQQDQALKSVRMTADSCERMLFNVVENAVNHAPSGSKVTISLRNRKKLLQIEVADHGCGVSQKKIPRLTERFYRLDTSRSEGGHGLGLAIVAEQLKQCEGTLDIRNNLPTGLLVTMNIPFSIA